MIESRATAVRYRSSLVIGFAISAMLVAPSSGATRAVHLRCRDGLLTPVASERVCSPGDLTGPCRPACDSDGVCDGLCTFVTTVCDDRGCAPHAFVVHAGRRKKFRLVTAVGMKPTRLVVRCLPHRHVVSCSSTATTTTTTTTSMTTCSSFPFGCTGHDALALTTSESAASCGGAGLNPPPGAPASGAIFSDASGTTKIDDLALGCLYAGGGKATTVPPSPIGDGAESFFVISGSNLVAQGVTGRSSCTAGAAPSKHCMNAHCATDADCNGTSGSCSSGACAPGTQAVAPSCSSDADCGGGLGSCALDANCYFGPPVPISAPPPNEALTTCVLNVIQTDASGTSDLAAGTLSVTLPLSSRVYVSGNSASPCPKCINGTCADGGEDTGHACATTSSLLMTHDCRPPLDGFQGALPVTLSPLTTGTASISATDGMFCPGQVAGAFGQPTSRAIVENGSPAGDVTDHVPHASRLASVFCIPKTGNLALDEAASLPGPGALGVETRVQIF